MSTIELLRIRRSGCSNLLISIPHFPAGLFPSPSLSNHRSARWMPPNQQLAPMDERAAISVTLPVENPTQSFWQDPPDPIARLRSAAEQPATADVVIVGSGITGAAVAWGLLSEDGKREVVMLEARDACSAATGRNGADPLSGPRGILCRDPMIQSSPYQSGCVSRFQL